MSYLVLAYPYLAADDFDIIQQYRKVNDALFYHVVNPHFTIVFPVMDVEENVLLAEVKEKASGVPKIDFVLRCATINKDAFSDQFHTFLVPDEGFSHFVKLHDRLYSGLLRDNHRLDIDYIPHMAVGGSKDKYACKAMVDEWNAKPFAIRGRISCLDIVKYENNVVTTIDRIELV